MKKIHNPPVNKTVKVGKLKNKNTKAKKTPKYLLDKLKELKNKKIVPTKIDNNTTPK